ncbi:MAG: glycosyltransferase [Proteobacteria bacterium]|nr:glycosyltransferase [Pseudomonadota bacterium]
MEKSLSKAVAPLRILLGQLAANGDCLYATTVARQIKHDHPDCHLTWCISSLCSHLLLNNPDVDEVWEYPMANRLDNAKRWGELELEAARLLAQGRYDRAYLTQLYPANMQNYDGTIRPSLLRGYGAPITVPVRSILRPTEQEQERVRGFAEATGLLDYEHRILFECSSASHQSFVTPEFALRVAELLLRRLPGACVVLSSHQRVQTDNPAIIDGSVLSIRETACLAPLCTLFAGCGSGLTVVATTTEQAPQDLPVVQFLLRDTSVYASFAEDFAYWELGAERFIETSDEDPEHAAALLAAVCWEGVAAARAVYHAPLPLTFDHYLSLVRQLLLGRGRSVDAARSLLLTTERFGWDATLLEYAHREVAPAMTGLGRRQAADGPEMLARLYDAMHAARGVCLRRKTFVFDVASVGDVPLPQPLSFVVDARLNLGQLEADLEASASALGEAIRTKGEECPQRFRGDAVGAATFSGTWRESPPLSLLVRPAPNFNVLPPNELEVAERAAGVVQQDDDAQTPPAWLDLCRQGAVVLVTPSPALRRSQLAQAGFDVGLIRVLAPRYGEFPERRGGFLRAAEDSFVHWLGREALAAEPSRYLFEPYLDCATDVALLRGLLKPGQAIGFTDGGLLPAPEGFGGLSTHAPSGARLYLEPGPDWLAGPPRLEPCHAWPRISVVMPSFNQARFVREALDSVLDQGYPNLELMVLDPGSTDGTREILEEYRPRLSRLVLEPDEGQSDALQRGLALASGTVLTWLCTDDRLEPGSLFRAAEALDRYGADLVVGGCLRIDDEGRELFRHQCLLPFGAPCRLPVLDIVDFLGSWQLGNYFYQPEVFFTADIWRRSGAMLWKSAYYGMDYDLWVRMALAGASIVHVPQVFAASREQCEQKTCLDGSRSPYLFQVENFMKSYSGMVRAMFAGALQP